GVGRRMREGIDDKAFPEQGAKVSIHSDGSFEGLGCVLANTNLNVLTAVFYWFTLKRDEPKKSQHGVAGLKVLRGNILFDKHTPFAAPLTNYQCDRRRRLRLFFAVAW
ncbi:hypothetical protein, partial [Serratia marcescens]